MIGILVALGALVVVTVVGVNGAIIFYVVRGVHRDWRRSNRPPRR